MDSGRLRLNAVVPAAGLSRRMGAFKPLLPLGRGTVIRSTLLSLLAGGAETVVLVTGYRAEELEAHAAEIRPGRVIFVRNPDYARSDMLRSVQLGCRALPPCDAFFLLPGDMPAVAPATMLALGEAFSAGGASIVFPVTEGHRRHPPLISAALLPEILSFQGDGGLRTLWRRHESDILAVPVEDPGAAADLDTPGDYERLKTAMKSPTKNGRS